jgi:2-oxoglutarate ferredoxin oxidoreductase subunit alpha
MSRDSVSVTLAGSGGSGVMTAGSLLLQAAGKAGWYGRMRRSSGPQIRGGEAAAMLRLSTVPVDAQDDRCDVLLAIDWQNIDRFAAEIPLDADSLVIGDPDAGAAPERITAMGARHLPLAMKSMAKTLPGGRQNMIALGVIARLIGLPLESLFDAVEASLARKGPEAVSGGRAAIEAGYEAAVALPPGPQLAAPRDDGLERWRITGNEAAGLGAVRAGVRYVAAYPITPATEMLEWLAPALARLDGALIQAEDELASINQVIGASFGGTPALTATSGPGLALMTEAIGLAIASETPITVVDVMRGGPSTGIPTKSEQTDLNIALYGMHGDAPHIVTAPTSVGDCLFTTQWSVYLAEALQTAAIVLSDQALGQTEAVIPKPPDAGFLAARRLAESPDHGYRRYAVSEDGISPASLPGTPAGEYTADGLEHNPRGTPSSSDIDHSAQLEKRAHKLQAYDFGEPWAQVEGTGGTAVLTWGSSTGPVREALARLRAEGIETRLIGLRLLAPAQVERLEQALAGVRRVLVVEQSHGRQFYHYLRAHYALPADLKLFARPGPLPIRPGEIYAQLRDWS